MDLGLLTYLANQGGHPLFGMNRPFRAGMNCACVPQAKTLEKRANKLRERLDLSLTSSWRSFQDLVACLVASHALEADTLRALPLGNVARQIHGENELWLAIVLTHPAVQVTHSCSHMQLYDAKGDPLPNNVSQKTPISQPYHGPGQPCRTPWSMANGESSHIYMPA